MVQQVCSAGSIGMLRYVLRTILMVQKVCSASSIGMLRYMLRTILMVQQVCSAGSIGMLRYMTKHMLQHWNATLQYSQVLLLKPSTFSLCLL